MPCLCSVETLETIRQCHHSIGRIARARGQGVTAQRSLPLGLIRTHSTSSVILRVHVLLTVSWRACVPSCSTMAHSQNLTSLSALPLTKPLQWCNTSQQLHHMREPMAKNNAQSACNTMHASENRCICAFACLCASLQVCCSGW